MSDLIDVMPFQYQIVESASGRFRVEGIFQKSDVENANKRIYPRRIWEKELGEQRVTEAIKNRSMFGELDHPSDGKTSLKRVAHLITGLELQEDGNVTGAAEILGTPNGQILKTLFESGAQVGISSRGSGSVQNGVVQEDFKLGTFDFVARPSTPGALPRPAGESERRLTKEEDETVDAIVTIDDGEGDSHFDNFLAELEAFDARLDEEIEPAGDLNAVAHDVIEVHNYVTSTNITPEIIDEVSDYIVDLGGALLQLAESNPEHRTVITELLDKVEETRGAIIKNAPKENFKEEPMDRLQFIKDRLQESQKDAEAQTTTETDELRAELNELSDDELINVAIEAGVIDENDLEDTDDKVDGDEEVTVQDLLDYIEELESRENEAATLIEEMAGALEEADNVDDVKLKYEAALGIIQETVSRYQLLQEAVGGEEKAYGLMEAHLTTLEASTEDGDIEEEVTDDKDIEDVETIERLLTDDGPEDATMARYKELSESALERLGAGILTS
jgi:hypothetical protein